MVESVLVFPKDVLNAPDTHVSSRLVHGSFDFRANPSRLHVEFGIGDRLFSQLDS